MNFLAVGDVVVHFDVDWDVPVGLVLLVQRELGIVEVVRQELGTVAVVRQELGTVAVVLQVLEIVAVVLQVHVQPEPGIVGAEVHLVVAVAALLANYRPFGHLLVAEDLVAVLDNCRSNADDQKICTTTVASNIGLTGS